MQRNVLDLGDVALRQRVLSGCGTVDLTTTLFGQQRPLPVMLGPVGIAGMFRRRGETQAARAAKAAGIPFCLSTVSLCSLPEVVQAAKPRQSDSRAGLAEPRILAETPGDTSRAVIGVHGGF